MIVPYCAGLYAGRRWCIVARVFISKSVIIKACDEDAALDVAHDLYYSDRIKVGPEGELSNDISELTPEEEAEYGKEYERWEQD